MPGGLIVKGGLICQLIRYCNAKSGVVYGCGHGTRFVRKHLPSRTPNSVPEIKSNSEIKLQRPEQRGFGWETTRYLDLLCGCHTNWV
jgi:hypothetical protein